MAKSIRFVRRGVQGRVRQNFNWPGVITARSVVHITAAEVGVGTTQRQPSPPVQDFFYHLGEASDPSARPDPHPGRNRVNNLASVLQGSGRSRRRARRLVLTHTLKDGCPIWQRGHPQRLGRTRRKESEDDEGNGPGNLENRQSRWKRYCRSRHGIDAICVRLCRLAADRGKRLLDEAPVRRR